MPYNEFKLTRTTPSQLRGVQESYYYDANDETLSEVLAAGYFTGFPCNDDCETVVTVNASDGWANVHPNGEGGSSESVNTLIGDKTSQQVSDGVDGASLSNKLMPNNQNGVLLPADPSLCTLTEGAEDANLTQFIRVDTNPEKFTHSAAIGVEFNGRQARLYTTTTVGTGNVGTNKNQVQPSWEFLTDAEDIALEIRQSSMYTIQIDDVFLSKATSTIPSDGNNDNTVLLNFPGKRTRKITINFSTSASGFSGVYVLPTDSVWPVDKTISMCIFGDSFSTGTSTNPAGLAWSSSIPKLFDIVDYQVSGLGGTGLINNAGDKLNYEQRFPTDCAYRDFDVVVVSASTNDGSETQGAIESAVDSLYTLIKTHQPNAAIIVTGAPRSVTTATQNTIDMEGWVLDRFNSKNDNALIAVPVLTSTAPPIYGTGDTGNLQGDGNADVYVDVDGLHFNDAGHNYYAVWLSRVIASAVRNRINALTAA